MTPYEHYLTTVIAQNQFIVLPLPDTFSTIALAAIFQPLRLRQTPLTPETQAHEHRQRLLGKQRQQKSANQETQPDVIVPQAQEALARSETHHIVILGGPGSGKTTVIHDLLVQAAHTAMQDPDAPTPIAITLPDLARSGLSLETYVQTAATSMDAAPNIGPILWSRLRAGQGFICLDGLDEVTAAARPALIAEMNASARVWGGTWIIGSRFTDYKGGQFTRGQFDEWELLPFDQQQRGELAERLFATLPQMAHGGDTTRFLADLAASPVAAWGESPLLFTLVALIYAQNGAFPATRATLYRTTIQAYLAARLPDVTARTTVFQQVAQMALRLHQVRGRTFTWQDMQDALSASTAMTSAPVAVTLTAAIDTGLLVKVAAETYCFYHQTFQEYLAAAALAGDLAGADDERRQAAQALLERKRTYSRWTEILRLMAGELVSAYGDNGLALTRAWLESLATLAETAEGDPGTLGIALATVTLADCDPGHLLPASAAANIVNRWVYRLKASFTGQSGVAERLTDLAASLRTIAPAIIAEPGEQLIAFLAENPRHPYVVKALQLLGPAIPLTRWLAIIDGPILPPLKSGSFETRQPSDDARIVAIEIVASRGDDAALSLFDRIFADETRDLALRIAVASHWPLRHMASFPLEAMITLCEQLRNVLDAQQKGADEQMAAKSVFSPKDQALYSWMVYIDLTQSAIGSLGRLGERAPIAYLASLLQRQDTNPNVPIAASDAIHKLRDRVPPEVLWAYFDNDEAQINRLAFNDVLKTMRMLGMRVPRERIVPLIQSKKSQDWFSALDAVATWGDDVPFDLIAPLLKKSDDRIWGRAIKILGRCKLVDPLVRLSQDRHPNKAAAAIAELGNLGTLVPIATLTTALQHPQFVVQQAALIALAKRGEIALADDAFHVIEQSNGDGKALALTVLGALGNDAPVAVIAAALGDPVAAVREAACDALGMAAERADPAWLLPLLDDQEREVADAAAYALTEFGARVPLDPVLQALRRRGVDFEDPLVKVLGTYGSDFPRSILETLVQSSVGDDRQVAAAIMGEMGSAAPLDLLLILVNEAPTKQSQPVRYEALQAVGKTRQREAIPDLIAIAQRQGDVVADSAAEALGDIGDPSAIPVLVDLLHAKSDHIREGAARGLAAFGALIPVDVMMRYAEEHRDDFEVQDVIEALGQAKEAVPIDFLIRVLHDASFDEYARMAAAHALGRLGDQAPLDALQQALHDEDFQVSSAAAESLGMTGNPAMLAVLVALLEDEQSPEGAEYGAVSGLLELARQGVAVPAAPLLTILDATADMRRKIALVALGYGDDSVPAEVFVHALNDDHLGTLAADILRRRRPAVLTDVAREALAIVQGEPVARHWLAPTTVLQLVDASGIATPAIIARLLTLTEWPANAIRNRAVTAFKRIRRDLPDTVIRRLLEMRHDAAVNVRANVEDALADILSLESGIEDD